MNTTIFEPKLDDLVREQETSLRTIVINTALIQALSFVGIDRDEIFDVIAHASMFTYSHAPEFSTVEVQIRNSLSNAGLTGNRLRLLSSYLTVKILALVEQVYGSLDEINLDEVINQFISISNNYQFFAN